MFFCVIHAWDYTTSSPGFKDSVTHTRSPSVPTYFYFAVCQDASQWEVGHAFFDDLLPRLGGGSYAFGRRLASTVGWSEGGFTHPHFVGVCPFTPLQILKPTFPKPKNPKLAHAIPSISKPLINESVKPPRTPSIITAPLSSPPARNAAPAWAFAQ